MLEVGGPSPTHTSKYARKAHEGNRKQVTHPASPKPRLELFGSP